MTIRLRHALLLLLAVSVPSAAATFRANHTATPFCPESSSVTLGFGIVNQTNTAQTITAGTVWHWNFTIPARVGPSNLPAGATAIVEDGNVRVSFANDVIVATNGALNFSVQFNTSTIFTPGPVTLSWTATPQGALFLETGQAIVIGIADPQSCNNAPVSAFTIDDLTATCPTAAEIAVFNADFQITLEGDPTASTQACVPEGGSAPLTRLQERAYQAMRLMQRIPFDTPLPWTSQQLYDWFKGAIRGIRFRNDIATSSCCNPANTINIQTQNLGVLQADGPEWIATLMILLAHEARHNEGFPHTCSANDETLQEMGAWGVQYHLEEYLAYRSGNFLIRKSGEPAFYRQFFGSDAMRMLNTRFCNLLPGLVMSPSALNFGTLPVGTSSPLRRVAATYTAGLPTPFTGTRITGANASDFALVYESCADVTLPRSCGAEVIFTPSAAGPRSATLSFQLNSVSLNVPLSGTGGTPPAGCTYSLSATQQAFAGSGGTGTIRVSAPAGCAWTAVSRAAFATVGAVSGGSGDGTVTYNVLANNAPSGRQGVLQIAGRTVTVTQHGAGAPFISTGGVVRNPSYRGGIASQTWVSVFGVDLSSATRTWTVDDFVQGRLPTALSGVSAKVNNKPAYIFYISPGLINLLAPDDTALGELQVEVTTPGGRSNFLLARKTRVAPDFFTFDNVYAAATHLNGSLLGKPNLIPGAVTTPATPGEIVVLYGSGFGSTSPGISAGNVVTQPGALTGTLSITLGGVAANVQFAGRTGSGLDQFNMEVPNLADGDYELIATINGVTTRTGVLITVKR